jgi:hypothetical protein
VVSSYNFLLLFKDYLHGLDKTQYEADLAEAGNDETKKKIIQVSIHGLFFNFLMLYFSDDN